MYGFQFSLPCVRSDKRRKEMTIYELNISILVPCVGSDLANKFVLILIRQFQFSLPAWGAILWRVCNMNATENFNSRPLRGERSLCVYDTLAHAGISILAPSMGSDITEFLLQVLQLISILALCEESDFVAISEGRLVVISILAPRMGSDIICSFSIMSPCIFNSRSPYGERHSFRSL